MTVLFNSLLLAEVEQMCDRVAILKQGRRVYEGRVSALAEDEKIFEIDVAPADRAVGVIEAAGGGMLSPGRMSLPPDADPSAVVAAMVGAGVRVSAFAPVRRSLEDLYLEMTR